MLCYLCGDTIDGPAVPRSKDGEEEPVYLHPACYETCCLCRRPVRVFQPVHVGVLYRDSGERRQIKLDGVWLTACRACVM